MPKQPDSAEIIPFDQVRRIVQERRRLRTDPASPEFDAGLPLPNTRSTSQVRRILNSKRASERPPTGPGATA